MINIGTKPIETERLHLRRFKVADAPAMFAGWANDPEVTRWLRWEPHQSPADSRGVLKEWVRGYRDKDFYLWAMAEKHTGELVGSIGILKCTEVQEPEKSEPGYCIGRRFWNQGYTTEALEAILAYYIKGTGDADLICCHAVENPASGRVMQKAGFVFDHEGVYHMPDGREIPARYYRYEGPLKKGEYGR